VDRHDGKAKTVTDDRDLLTVRQTADALETFPASVMRWARNGDIPSVDIAGKMFIPADFVAGVLAMFAETLSTSEVAEELGITTQGVIYHVRKGNLDVEPWARRYRIYRYSVNLLKERLQKRFS